MCYRSCLSSEAFRNISVRTTGRRSSPNESGMGSGSPQVKTLHIESGSSWENGHIESFNSKLRDELLER